MHACMDVWEEVWGKHLSLGTVHKQTVVMHAVCKACFWDKVSTITQHGGSPKIKS